MDIDALDTPQFAEALYKYFENGDYWIFVIPMNHKINSQQINDMENKYYKPGTEANRDFVMFTLPPQGFIFAAAKSRMDDKQLEEYIPKGDRKEHSDCFFITSDKKDPSPSDFKFFDFVQTELHTIFEIKGMK